MIMKTIYNKKVLIMNNKNKIMMGYNKNII